MLNLTIPRYITSIRGHQTLQFVSTGGRGVVNDTVDILPIPTTLVELRNWIRDMPTKEWNEFVHCIDIKGCI